MHLPVFTRQFHKDLKRSRRRGKDMEKFKRIARALLNGESLDSVHRDHRLLGRFAGRRECHMEFNWLLVYQITDHRIYFERMGTHTDLYKK